MSKSDTDIAEEAYAQLNEGLMHGKWDAFFALFADEVDLILPYPPAVGHFTGAEGREKLASFFENLGVEGNRVTNVISTEKVVGEDRVVFEDHWSGEFFGQPAEGRDVIVITAAGGKVVAFHEYVLPAA
jgi:ketosteroid isomerase-like protein